MKNQEKSKMTYKLGLTLATVFVLAGAAMLGSVSESAARTAQDRLGTATDISAQANKLDKLNVGRRNVGQQRNLGVQRNIGQQNLGLQRNIGQQRNFRQQRNIGQQNLGLQRNIGRQRDIGQQRTVGQPGRELRAIRGARRATITGRNFSIWRGSHRVRRGGQWRTFVGLSALSAVVFGATQYYPYAYIDAPAPLCRGLTEDGCQLQWQAVPTVEGPMELQCVAYCPWQ
jgi:hypothetical protein